MQKAILANYYGGCEYVDVVEQLAIDDRAKALFGADYATFSHMRVLRQNSAVYWRFLTQAIPFWV